MRCAPTLPVLLVTIAAAATLVACSSAAPAPTDTPATSVTPDPQARTATAVAASATRFSYAPVRVTRGELAQFLGITAPNTVCDVTVTYASGPPNIDAPPTQPADREGNLRITWRVIPAAPVGPGTIVVKCNGDTVRATFTVV